MNSSRLRVVVVGIAAMLLVGTPSIAQETWSWLGGTADVAAPSNWSLSAPGGLVGPPGVTGGSQFGRIAKFGASGSTTLTQSNPNYWLEQFIFEPGAQAYTYTATDPAGYLSFGPANTALDINVIDNQSTSLQVFNLPSTGTGLGYDGYIKSNAGGGDVVVNGPVLAGDGSTSGARFAGATGSGNIYFNVDTTVHPNGNVNGGDWTSATINANAYANTRGRFFTDGLSGRVYLGNIGTAYRGSIHLNSNQGGYVRLTHNNSLGNQGANGGTGSGIPALFIQGGSVELDPVTAYSTTLELTNNISVMRGVMYMGPRAGATIGNTPHISNVSGNNTLTIGVDWNTYGTNSRTAGFISGNWNIESQAGTLTIAGGTGGGLIFNTANVNVDLQLMGAGNGVIDVPINTWVTNPSLNIRKKGTGTWTLTNANVGTLGGGTFKGNVTIEQGKLALTGAGSLAEAPSIDIRSGATLDVSGVGGYTLNTTNLMLKGAGTIMGGLTAGFNNTIAPGDSGTGTFNIAGDAFFFGDSTLQYELTSNPAGSNDKIAVVGNLNLFGTTAVNVLPVNGSLGAGTYQLMTYTGSLSGDATNLSLSGTPVSPRQSFMLSTSTPKQVNLVVTGSAADLTWVGGVNANAWDVGSTINWTGHPTDNRFYDGDKVTFATSGTNAPNIVGTVAPGQVNFTNGAGKNYTLSGGTMNVASNMTLSGAGNVTFSNDATSVAGNVTITGASNVNITNGTFSVTGQLAMNGTGTVTFANSSAATSLPSSVAINSGTVSVNRVDDMIGITGVATNFTGSGTFRKQNANTVDLTGNNSGFTGTMIVETGTLATRGDFALANTVVQAGATLDVGDNGNATPGGGTKAVTISGAGVAGLGAISVTAAGPDAAGNNAHIGALTLAADATIRAKSPGTGTTNRAILWVDGPITGNGHALTAIVDASISGATEIDFVNNGAMNIGNLNLSGGGAFYVGGTTDLGASGTITLGDVVLNGDPTDNTTGRLGVYGNQSGNGEPVSINKKIVVTSIGGGFELYRQTGTYVMGSDIQMNGDLVVDLYNSLNNTVSTASFSGAITGTGNLSFHVSSSSSTRTGTVELTSNGNTYTGTTTIGGGGGYSGVTAANDRINAISIGNGGATGSIGTGLITINQANDDFATALYLNRTGAYTVSANINMTGVANGVTVASIAAGSPTLSGVISGTGQVVVNSGTLTLSGNNTYTGNTTISGGTLLVNGMHTGGGAYTVNSGGTLGGTGQIGSTVTVNSGGAVAPGASIESIDVSALTLEAGSLLNFELGAPTNADRINVTTADSFTANGGTFNFTNAGGLAAGTYTLIDYSGTLGGAFSNLAVGSSPFGFSFALVNNLSNTSIDVMVTGAFSPDFNNDGKVNAADYVLWRKNPSMFGGPAGYTAWRAAFGNPPGSGAGLDGGAVPEPTVCGLALSALLALVSVRRRAARSRD